jgi:multimeric flavodoxin WrbA
MLVVGFQGSPRRKGNTERLLALFMEEAHRLGAKTVTVDAAKHAGSPCIGCGFCESHGTCSLKDETQAEIFPLLRRADLIVLASPVYFFNVPAQLKAIIDRCQTFWSRRYMQKLSDPSHDHRKGVLLSVGGSNAKRLFEGLELTANYFFDAVGASFDARLTYGGVDARGEIDSHPTHREEIAETAARLIAPMIKRTQILFAGTKNDSRSQMAEGFARKIAGDRIAALSGGSRPAGKTDPEMVAAMAERGIDMAYRIPRAIDDAFEEASPHLVVDMGTSLALPGGIPIIHWDLPDPAGMGPAALREMRDAIEAQVKKLIESI